LFFARSNPLYNTEIASPPQEQERRLATTSREVIYLQTLKGEQIPLAARIFAVIDVWDAVTIDRPYRKGWTKKKALSYIKEQSGKHFEPGIVDVFLEMFGGEKS
jgi:hypothetical protein